MHGRHIALFPLPGRSHIYPFLGLCRELVRRGWRVTLVTDEFHAKLVAPAGAEPVIVEPSKPYMIPLQTDAWPAHDPRWWDIVGGFSFPWMLNSAVLAVWQLDKFYRENRPDLIIYDFGAYAGRILARRLHTPVIQYYHDFIHHSGRYCWEGGVGYNPKSIVEFSKLLDSILWAYGFEEVNNFWRSEELNLCPFPKEFQFDTDSIDDRRFCFVGPFLDRPLSHVWKNCSGGKRIILVSAITGSSVNANYFNKIIGALSASEYHVILSVGESFPISELRTIPENFEINRYASHLEILPYTALHLYSGGIGGTLEGFYFGVPLIALPSYGPNYKLANRVAELGFAVNLPIHELTNELIRDSVDRVLKDDDLLARVKKMQRVVKDSGGSASAVDRIERFLTESA